MIRWNKTSDLINKQSAKRRTGFDAGIPFFNVAIAQPVNVIHIVQRAQMRGSGEVGYAHVITRQPVAGLEQPAHVIQMVFDVFATGFDLVAIWISGSHQLFVDTFVYEV